MSHLLWKCYCELPLSHWSTFGRWQKIPVTKDQHQELEEAVVQLEKKRTEVSGDCGKDYIGRASYTGMQKGHPMGLEIQSGCFSPHRFHLKFNLATQTWPCSMCHPRGLINASLFWKAALYHWKPSVTALLTQEPEYSLTWTCCMTTDRKNMHVLELKIYAFRNVCMWPILL